MEKALVLAFIALGSDHIENVKTLQSLYKQTYENIILVAFNDCSVGFQSERFFYNLNNNKPENIRQVVFSENKYPLGAEKTKRKFLERFKPDYTVTLCSGDRFSTINAITKSVQAISISESTAAAVCSVDLYSKGAFLRNLNAKDVALCIGDDSKYAEDIPECGVMFRGNVLIENEISSSVNEPRTISLLRLLSKKYNVSYIEDTLCQRHKQKLYEVSKTPNKQDTELPFEKTENERLKEKLSGISSYRALYTLSRAKRIIIYGLLTAFFFAATLFAYFFIKEIPWITIALAALCIVAFLFTLFVLIINLLIKWIQKG